MYKWSCHVRLVLLMIKRLNQVSIRSMIHLSDMSTSTLIYSLCAEWVSVWGEFSSFRVDMGKKNIAFPTWFLLSWASLGRSRWCSERHPQKEPPQGVFSAGDGPNPHKAGPGIPWGCPDWLFWEGCIYANTVKLNAVSLCCCFVHHSELIINQNVSCFCDFVQSVA